MGIGGKLGTGLFGRAEVSAEFPQEILNLGRQRWRWRLILLLVLVVPFLQALE
jgi:hypothetical protein